MDVAKVRRKKIKWSAPAIIPFWHNGHRIFHLKICTMRKEQENIERKKATDSRIDGYNSKIPSKSEFYGNYITAA